MPDEQTVPQDGQTEQQVPSTPENDGKTTQDSQDAHSQSVPKNLEGKSQGDLIKMYGELERKLGENSAKVGEANKIKQDMGVLLEVIYSDPDVKGKVETGLRKLAGLDGQPKKDDSPANESREVLEGQIIGGFLDKVGVYNLPPEQAGQVVDRIRGELRGLFDPSGKKTNAEIAKGVDLRELPTYLEKAYRLATQDTQVQQAMQEGMNKAKLTGRGAFGGIPSSSNQEEGEQLSEDERLVARKLGISEEDYLKHRKVE